MRRFIVAVLVTGFLLNLTGWAGNVFLPGSMWAQAGTLAPPPMRSPFSPMVHVILQFASDFVLAFVLCIVYRLASRAGVDQEWNYRFFAPSLFGSVVCRCVILE